MIRISTPIVAWIGSSMRCGGGNPSRVQKLWVMDGEPSGGRERRERSNRLSRLATLKLKFLVSRSSGCDAARARSTPDHRWLLACKLGEVRQKVFRNFALIYLVPQEYLDPSFSYLSKLHKVETALPKCPINSNSSWLLQAPDPHQSPHYLRRRAQNAQI